MPATQTGFIGPNPGAFPSVLSRGNSSYGRKLSTLIQEISLVFKPKQPGKVLINLTLEQSVACFQVSGLRPATDKPKTKKDYLDGWITMATT